MKTTLLLASLFAALLCGCQSNSTSGTELPLRYPTAAREDTMDDYFGVAVADPYRWLEDLESSRTAAWVEEQNRLSSGFLEALPRREALIERLTALWNYERFSPPVVRGGQVIWSHNSGLQNQSVLWIAPLATAPEQGRILFDPNTLSEDGTVALGGWALSPDGRSLAYAVSDGGSDWRSWHVLDVVKGSERGDLIEHTKFTSVSWAPDSQSFYYSRYPLGEDGKADESRQVAVYHHRLGTPQSSDRKVYEISEHPTRNPYARVTDDGRYLVFNIFDGYQANGIYTQDLSKPDAPVVKLLDAWDARYEFLGNDGSLFYFKTDKDAPKGRVIAVDLQNPAPAIWREVIPQGEDILESAHYVGGRMIAVTLHHASSRVLIHKLDGSLERELDLGGLVSVSGFAGEPRVPVVFYAVSSFTNPGEVRRLDLESGESKRVAAAAVDFDPALYDTQEAWVVSKDGTKVHAFIVSKKGVGAGTQLPTLLYGYGGFDISLTPRFSVSTIAWLEMGGRYVVANLRGGGEYGSKWHEAGTKLDKQNVFDDFIAVAEWLIASGYTSSGKLAIQGGSNGGLLVGACMTQRPELFGACLPAVGVLDMLRYHLQSANARQWSSDYGLSENEDEFKALHAYSPLHAVKKGTAYPPTLVTTGMGDNRVAPWHSFKFGATLQDAQGGPSPILLSVETRAGHGAGKPTQMRIEEIANRLAFLAWALDVEE